MQETTQQPPVISEATDALAAAALRAEAWAVEPFLREGEVSELARERAEALREAIEELHDAVQEGKSGDARRHVAEVTAAYVRCREAYLGP